MAIEFDIMPENNFFINEDKILSFTIFQADGVTPLDVSSFLLEWNMRRTDAAADPTLLTKGLGSGLSVVGVYNVNPSLNTQAVQVAFAAADTKLMKAGSYRHSLKRIDPGSFGILSWGTLTLLVATEH